MSDLKRKERIVDLLIKGVPIKDISKKTGVTQQYVGYIRKSLPENMIEKRATIIESQKYKQQKLAIVKVQRYHREHPDASYEKISAKTGTPVYLVRKYLKNAKGTKVSLTPEEIKGLLDRGITKKELSDMFGITQGYLSQYLKRYLPEYVRTKNGRKPPHKMKYGYKKGVHAM